MALIQVRNVPDEVHRTLKARAALAGVSLSDLVLAEITRAANTPTPEELDARIRARRPAPLTTEEILDARDSGRRP